MPAAADVKSWYSTPHAAGGAAELECSMRTSLMTTMLRFVEAGKTGLPTAHSPENSLIDAENYPCGLT